MYVVDASVWVSFFVPQDVNHDASTRWLTRQIRLDTPIMLPTIALAEAAGAVARLRDSSILATEATILLQILPSIELMPVDDGLARIGASVASTLRLRGSDAIYVALAQRLGVPLVTWDAEQLDRGKSAAQTMTPNDPGGLIP